MPPITLRGKSLSRHEEKEEKKRGEAGRVFVCCWVCVCAFGACECARVCVCCLTAVSLHIGVAGLVWRLVLPRLQMLAVLL